MGNKSVLHIMICPPCKDKCVQSENNSAEFYKTLAKFPKMLYYIIWNIADNSSAY